MPPVATGVNSSVLEVRELIVHYLSGRPDTQGGIAGYLGRRRPDTFLSFDSISDHLDQLVESGDLLQLLPKGRLLEDCPLHHVYYVVNPAYLLKT